MTRRSVRIEAPKTQILRHTNFRISPVHFAQRLADLADGCIGAYRVHDVRHRVCLGNLAVASRLRLLRGGLLQRVERRRTSSFDRRARSALQLRRLRPGHALVDVQNLRRLFLDHEIIDANDDFLARLGRPLILVRRFRDLFLRKSALDRFHHAAHLIELREVFECAFFHVESLFLDEVRSAERIDRLRHA